MKIEENLTCLCLGTGKKICTTNFGKMDENATEAGTSLAFLIRNGTKGGK